MISIPWPVRYSFGLAVCLVIAISPWAMTMLYSPLPPDLRLTATALSSTRTAQLAPKITAEPDIKTEVVAMHTSLEPTPSPTVAVTAAASPTSTPTVFRTATLTFTPTPEVSGIANEIVNAYICPGVNNKLGKLEAGAIFVILGWDEMVELKETVTYLLIENELDKPQKWIKDSEYVLLAVPDYKGFIPRLACRK